MALVKALRPLVSENCLKSISYRLLENTIIENYIGIEYNDDWPNNLPRTKRLLENILLSGIDIDARNMITDDNDINWNIPILYTFINTYDVDLIMTIIDLGSDINKFIKEEQSFGGILQFLFYRYDQLNSNGNDMIKIVDLLIENGVNLNPEYLLEYNYDPQHKIFFYTPLEFAIIHIFDTKFLFNVIRRLVQGGARVDFGDNKTILLYMGQIKIMKRITISEAKIVEDIMKYLIRNGASITTRDERGRTAYDILKLSKVKIKTLEELLKV